MTLHTIVSTQHRLETQEITAVELLGQCEARADLWDAPLGVYLHRSGTTARAQAVEIDERRARGEPLGPLAGIPLGIKDIIRTADAPTTAQSLIPDGARVDAPVVARLRRAGALLTGKTSTMEYALGFSDPEKPFPTPRNPWDLRRWTGGSSSGTGAGIAADLFLGGLGTDTAGSIRMPAAWCGVTGHKPTYGLVPRTGVYPLGWSYDHVGPLARTAEDCALLLSVLAGADVEDPSVGPAASFAFTREPLLRLERLRIGLALDPLERSTPDVQRLVRAAAEILALAGASVAEVRLPFYEQGCDVTMLGLAAEALSYHRPDLTTRWHDYGRSTRSALMIGALMSGADYVQIQRVRRLVVREVARLFDQVDLVLAPTASCPAPLVEDLDFGEVVSMLQTHYWNATGNPAISVPMGVCDGLPVGLQIIGPPFADQAVLDVARHYQGLTSHHLRAARLSPEGPA